MKDIERELTYVEAIFRSLEWEWAKIKGRRV